MGFSGSPEATLLCCKDAPRGACVRIPAGRSPPEMARVGDRGLATSHPGPQGPHGAQMQGARRHQHCALPVGSVRRNRPSMPWGSELMEEAAGCPRAVPTERLVAGPPSSTEGLWRSLHHVQGFTTAAHQP